MTSGERQPPVGEPPDIPGAEHRFAEIATADAGRLGVHYAEAGQGRPLLLLHGWPQHFWCWRRVVPLLAADYRLICPDLRGFGWTDAPGRGYDPETFAADAVALLDALGLERAGVIGHDWGGFSSLLMGLDHPQRVQGLLALGTPTPWPKLSPRLALETWRTSYAWGLAAAGRELVQRRPGVLRAALRRGVPDEAIDDQAAEVYAASLRRPASAEATQQLYRGYVRSAISIGGLGRYRHRRLTVPTRLLLGRRDQAVPEVFVRGFEEHADDMRLEMVDAGHFLPEECPELVARRAAELF